MAKNVEKRIKKKNLRADGSAGPDARPWRV